MLKCPKCGTQNLEGTERCKNCEYPLKEKIIFYEQPDRVKNVILLILFNIIFCIFIPAFFMLYTASLDSSFYYKPICVILSCFFVLFGEIISYKLTYKIVKNNYQLKNILSWYTALILIVYMPSITLINVGIALFLIISAILSYFVILKFFIKEKITFKPVYTIIIVVCCLITFMIPNLQHPTKINKWLYNTFVSDFDSKALKIKLVDNYNADNWKNITYLHKFSEEELSEITELTINKKLKDVTSKDLSKFTNLKNLTIKNITVDDLDFSKNKNLAYLELENVKFESDFYINENININEIEIYDSKFNDININSDSIVSINAENCNANNIKINNSNHLSDLIFINSKINSVVINDNKTLKNIILSIADNITINNMGDIKDFFDLFDVYYSSKIVFKKFNFDDKSISFSNDEYIMFDGDLSVKENSLVKDLILENLTVKVYDYYHDVIYDNQTSDLELGDKLYLYDLNGTEVLNCWVYNLSDNNL